MNEPDHSFVRNYERRGPGNVDCFETEPVVNAISLGHASVFIEQKREAGRVLLQELFRLEHPVSLFGRHIDQLHFDLIEFRTEWLQLSQPLAAVGSPGATQELDPDGTVCK